MGIDRAAKPRPFLRWLGSSRRVLAAIAPLVPDHFGAYHEPFVGSGSAYFWLVGLGRIRHGAFLADANPELVLAYSEVRDHPEALAAALEAHWEAHSAAHFRAVQELDRSPRRLAELGRTERAARFVYLTNAAFNGSWRVRADGRSIATPRRGTAGCLADRETLLAASAALRPAALAVRDFRDVVQIVRPGDLVLLDPPYLNAQGRDTGRYTARKFQPSDAADVVELVLDLDRRGVQVVLSVRRGFAAERLRDGGFRCVEIPDGRGGPETLYSNTAA